MDKAVHSNDRQTDDEPITVSAAYAGNPDDIAQARDLARAFLTRARTEYGLPVCGTAVDTVRLVVSELLTNACKHAPGPCLLDLELRGDRVEITVRDRALGLPVAHPADPYRVGRHGLEIVTAVAQSFTVHREPVGKRTTAAVALTGLPGERAAAPRP
ncbi:ATP-binding protein [Streptomyces minutiscleroticus]|uniref:ATP-binding protein n=1 Tax=Streptomyces minutiscleroticus TaxID=68238 RepID=A0A918NDK0_9ACTN|nr:ATP-binding protein [Streptomyces minutiscleroticus]GGX60023.1 ATP-binding protein [Streptomyces minutiscleroticus]